MYMYTYIYMCVYTCTHIYIYVCTYIHIQKRPTIGGYQYEHWTQLAGDPLQHQTHTSNKRDLYSSNKEILCCRSFLMYTGLLCWKCVFV